jgi:hypothetical protein
MTPAEAYRRWNMETVDATIEQAFLAGYGHAIAIMKAGTNKVVEELERISEMLEKGHP